MQRLIHALRASLGVRMETREYDNSLTGAFTPTEFEVTFAPGQEIAEVSFPVQRPMTSLCDLSPGILVTGSARAHSY